MILDLVGHKLGGLLLRHESMTYVKLNQLSCWFFYAYFRNPVLFGRFYHFTYSSVDF